MSLLGKVALVTGAAQGIGKAFSEALLKRGANVCVADIKSQTGKATVSGFQERFNKDRAVFMKCDVSREEDIKATFEGVKSRYGGLDIVVNNAGIADESNWTKMIDINLKGVILGTQYAVEAMRKDKGGNGGFIMNTSSSAGLKPVYIIPAYTASKYGIVGFTNSWAENPYLKSMGLSFACMCPTFADTELVDGFATSDKTLYQEDTRKLIETFGVQSVSHVAEAFEQLLDTPDNNGVVVTVTHRGGIRLRRPKQ